MYQITLPEGVPAPIGGAGGPAAGPVGATVIPDADGFQRLLYFRQDKKGWTTQQTWRKRLGFVTNCTLHFLPTRRKASTKPRKKDDVEPINLLDFSKLAIVSDGAPQKYKQTLLYIFKLSNQSESLVHHFGCETKEEADLWMNVLHEQLSKGLQAVLTPKSPGFTSLGKWEIDLEEIKFDEKVRIIGSGGAASVRKGVWRGTEVAIKMLFPSGTEVEDLAREVSTLRGVSHPNIVQFMGAILKKSTFAIVTQYIKRGSLSDVLANTSHMYYYEPPVSWRLFLNIAGDIARAMIFLHTYTVNGVVSPILHRDLKPANLLVVSMDEEAEVNIKVADFGVAKSLMKSNMRNTSKVGTFRYMAPEMVNGKNYDKSIDVYSFAMVLSEVILRKPPLHKYEFDSGAIQAVVKGERPVLPSEIPKSISDLIQQSWEESPEKRPSFSEILQRVNEFLVICHQFAPLSISGAPSTGPGKGRSESIATPTLHYPLTGTPSVAAVGTPTPGGAGGTSGGNQAGSPERRDDTTPGGNLGSGNNPTPAMLRTPTVYPKITDSPSGSGLRGAAIVVSASPSPPQQQQQQQQQEPPVIREVVPRPDFVPAQVDVVELLFGNKIKIPYVDFEQGLIQFLQCTAIDVKTIFTVLRDVTRDPVVTREKFSHLLQWFSPLVVEDDLYLDSPECYYDNRGTRISQIARLISSPWFHGFMSSTQAQDILRYQPPGSYLFRFSTEIGKFALSVHYDAKIQHTRVSLVPITPLAKGFQLQGLNNAYPSLENLIVNCPFLEFPVPKKTD